MTYTSLRDALDRATRQWAAARRFVVNETSGDTQRDLRAALEAINELRAVGSLVPLEPDDMGIYDR